MVVNAKLVVIAAAHPIVTAHHLMGGDGAGRHAELIETAVEHGNLIFRRDLFAVYVEPDTLVFVPADRQMRPGIGRRQLIEFERDADAREVVIGNEGIVAVAVIVDAQERHVPAGMIGITDAE